MFVARSKAIINKPASAINLKQMITLPFIQGLDSEILHAPITAQNTMPVVAGRPNIPNFQALCNKDDVHISRPSRELSLEKFQRPGQPWCSDTSRSICIESCYIFDEFYKKGVSLLNRKSSAEDQKDLGMASQSEMRYFVSEAEMGKKVPLAALTGISTPVRGILEQNIFYFNQIVRYGKIVAVFQEHPTDASKTILTSFLAFAIQTATYEKEFSFILTVKFKDILMGRAGKPINTATGITAGLPFYSLNIAKTLAKRLDEN